MTMSDGTGTADDKQLTILEVVAKIRALPRIQWTVPDPYADWLADREEENRESEDEEEE